MTCVFSVLRQGQGWRAEGKGDIAFLISTLFTNPKGPEEQVQAQGVRKACREDCAAARLEKSRTRCLWPLLSQTLKNLWQQRGRVSEEESVFKAHLLEHKT